MPNTDDAPQKGVLYVVATPIGNRDDITLRALSILQQVDLIAAEDTRKSGRFLAHHRIRNRLVSYHEHNEKKRTSQLIEKLLAGTSMALISNAGTPSLSDPGFRLISAAIDHRIRVIPVPGVTAATAAMSVSGLPTDAFIFVGFAPRKKTKRIKFLRALGTRSESVIFYESPNRITALMADIIACMGDRYAVLAREMTKLHEEFLRGAVSQILKEIRSRAAVKGECTLLVAGGDPSEEPDIRKVKTALESALDDQTGSLSEIARRIARNSGLPKKTVYDLALKIRYQRSEVRGQSTENRSQKSEDRGQKTDIRRHPSQKK